MTVRCLSVRQPWAAFIVAGIKKVECRSWCTSHRGRILIHASLRRSSTCPELSEVQCAVPPELLAARGVILGECDLADCREATQEDRDAALCDIDDGIFAWVLKNARAFRDLIPLKGKLGLFNISL